MGLFGYNEKDFEKNKQIIVGKISALMGKVPNRFAGDKLKSGALLNSLMLVVEDMAGEPVKYPKGANKKEMEAIDQRIFKLFDTLDRDLQERAEAKFSEHIKMLQSVIVDSRPYGVEKLSPEEIDMQEKMANILGELTDNMAEKDKAVKERDQYLARAQQLMKEGKRGEAEKINPQYQRSLHQISMAEKMVTALSAQYNQYLEVIEAKLNRKIAKKLNANQLNAGSIAELQRDIAQGTAELTKELDTINEIRDIAKDAIKEAGMAMQNISSSSSVTSDAEAANAASMDFSSAQYTSSSSAAPSILDDAISKNN